MYKVIKRNGSIVDFDIHRIEIAISKAFEVLILWEPLKTSVF